MVTVGVVPVVTGRPGLCLTRIDFAILLSYIKGRPDGSSNFQPALTGNMENPMPQAKSKNTPSQFANELTFTDFLEDALRRSGSIVETVMAAIAENQDSSHLHCALDIARDNIDAATAAVGEWWERVGRPARIAREKSEAAAQAALPVTPMEIAQIERLEALCRRDRAALKSRGRK